MISLLKLCFIFYILSDLGAYFEEINPSPIHEIMNTNLDQSLINSVDFHPKNNLFCVTFTHNNSIIIYKLNKDNTTSVFQILKNPTSKLSCPQHALFSRDGTSLLVANWVNQTFNIYHSDLTGIYQSIPIAIIPFPYPTENFRPHGIAFSQDGNYLAVAYGASKQDPKAIAIFQINDLANPDVNFKLVSLIQNSELDRGIPKGITFSPDGTCLLVTLSETNAVMIYKIDLLEEGIVCTPRQIFQSPSSLLSRPEDIKFTIDGNHIALSNSNKDTITFYLYDKENNYIMDESPSFTLENPRSQLNFPHGLAFSPDGNFLSVTQFGPVLFDKNSNLISWGTKRKDSVLIFKLN